MNNQELNQDLFDIVNGHSYDTYEIEHNKVPEHLKVSRTESKKNKKMAIKLPKKNLKKITIAALGTIVVLSSSLIVNMALTSNNNQEDNEVTITVIDNILQDNKMNDSNALKNDDINVAPKIMLENKGQIIDDNKEEKKELFEIGTNQYIDYVYKYMKNDEYRHFEKNANMYGAPAEVMVAMDMQESNLMHKECSPGGEYYNGCAIGIMQLEKNCNNAVTAYNYDYNKDELAEYSDEELCDIENNIKVGFMRFQKAIEKYHGNIYIAIQAHNFGEVMMDKAIELTAKEKDVDIDEILENYQDLSWLKYVEDIHDNPKKYLSNWGHDTYGDSKYLYKVLSYCPSDKITYKYNGNDCNFNLQYGISDNVDIKHI